MTIPNAATQLFSNAVDVEIFTAPGTWTWPGNNKQVRVVAVGGGGSGGNFGAAGAGGGGAVVYHDLPVESPLSVVIGAGGTTSDNTGGLTSISGTNFLVEAGGGGRGGNGVNPFLTFPDPLTFGVDAPPIGGGGGGGGLWQNPAVVFANQGGAGGLGAPGGWPVGDGEINSGINIPGNGVADIVRGGGGGGARGAAYLNSGGAGRFGFGGGGAGGGGQPSQNGQGGYSSDGGGKVGEAGKANTGGGGSSGLSGGSGIVIIGRWK